MEEEVINMNHIIIIYKYQHDPEYKKSVDEYIKFLKFLNALSKLGGD